MTVRRRVQIITVNRIDDEDLVEIVDPDETFGSGIETKGESSYRVKSSVQDFSQRYFDSDTKYLSQTASNCAPVKDFTLMQMWILRIRSGSTLPPM